MSDAYKNTFWIGGNLLFDLQNGRMSEVLELVYREQDASTFTQEFGSTVLSFVSTRTDGRNLKIRWSFEKSKLRPALFVIKGEQDV